ncbi:hypothetical protein HYH02_014644 [Chlamydomonas schloesseri]|uniref:RAP domain-containing protein n=1 Tax=Chlamydomonas schloesseri TaxID=2026947 RepID=A0A835VTH7_9CHLO|nr:hypothetical protein HYH02_014644 [Chlamydomonas schloesseri]|eukprot:KAG2427240.1 hypothetical protein HYH02_014644 [Chlamydomonas schloesseri]
MIPGLTLLAARFTTNANGALAGPLLQSLSASNTKYLSAYDSLNSPAQAGTQSCKSSNPSATSPAAPRSPCLRQRPPCAWPSLFPPALLADPRISRLGPDNRRLSTRAPQHAPAALQPRAGGGTQTGTSGTGPGGQPPEQEEQLPTLSQLQAAIRDCKLTWVANADLTSLNAAFFLAAHVPAAPPAVADGVPDPPMLRAAIVAELAQAYLPLVPHIQRPGECSTPLLALGRVLGHGGEGAAGNDAEISGTGNKSSDELPGIACTRAHTRAGGGSRRSLRSMAWGLLATALVRRLLQPGMMVKGATAHEMCDALVGLDGLLLGRTPVAKRLVGVIAAEARRSRAWLTAALEAALPSGLGGAGAMDGAGAKHWVAVLQALAAARYQPPPEWLDAAAAAAATGAFSGGSGRDCSVLLYALAVLRLRHAGLEAAVCGRLGELLSSGPAGSLNSQDIATSLWAVALWQAQQELGGEVAAALGSSPGLQAAMAAAVEVARAEATESSRQQKQVAAALRRLQRQGRLPITSVKEHAEVEGSMAQADIELQWVHCRARSVVEFDGPTHYLANRPHDPSAVDGPTALRNRQLARTFGEGRVLCVPHWEWGDLKGDPARQEAYLLRRLHAAAAPLPAAVVLGPQAAQVVMAAAVDAADGKAAKRRRQQAAVAAAAG